ncbi:uncharacterized protein LOC134076256 [Sardina pilchardus]|uniref:uncharacterized protein LOC134076256 n=1 Tax=Sardina pilchardus TaxID=27697 RepID=UPI002E0FBE3E
MKEEEENGDMITRLDEEEKRFTETETDIAESNVMYNETTQTTMASDSKKEEDEHEYLLESKSSDSRGGRQQDPVSLAQLKRVSVVLVDCCRPQGRRGKEEEMQTQTNGDAQQPETSVSEHQHVTQQKLHGDNDDLNLETGDRPHRCTQCGKAFSYRNHLSRHMLVHTGEKSHRCTQCGKVFSRRYRLSRHMLVHTGEKSHKCIQCGKGFSCRHHLSRHMIVHTREKSHNCTQCGKGFSRRYRLSQHMRVHIGEKNLSGHMLAHIGVNPVGRRQLVKGDTNDEEYGRMIGEDKDEEKPFAELHCRSETDVSDSIDDTLQIVKTEVKKDEDKHDYLLENPVSLAQMKRVSVVLVDCCRPQGRRVKEEEMQIQTNGDAEQPETNPVSLAQMKRVSVVLVDCCRPQGRRGKEEEMQTQTNGDAEQPETNPVSLAQMKRVSVVLVDCCRPQGRRRKEGEMQIQTNGDAQHIETNPVSLAQMKRVSVVLVDCCRPQGRRGKEEEMQMQTNGDAEQPETSKRPETMSDVENDEFGPSVMVKEEKYGHKIPCQDEEEKPLAELHCRTETDVQTESNVTCNETQTKLEKKEEDVTDYLLGSVSEHQHVTQQKLHGDNDDLNLETGDTPHRCTQCGKAFSRKHHLSRHMLVHTGEKSHKCIQCGKAFSRKYHLSRHMLVHKGVNMLPTQIEEMAHKCSECGQSFSLISNLESHMLIHTKEEPHKCAQCGEAFRTFTQLQCHAVVHIRAETDLSAAGCAETDPVGPRPLVQGDTNDKEYDHTIGEHEEGPFAELYCKTDVTDSIDDTLQTTVKTDLAGPRSDENMGQPLSASGCAETNPVGPRPLVKEGDTNDEEYGRMISEDKDEEKPFAEFHCITETDVTDSIDDTLQIVKIKVKKDEDEHDYLLESVSEHQHVTQQKLHGDNDDLNLETGDTLHRCTQCGKAFSHRYRLSRHMLVHTGEKSHKCIQCGKGFSRKHHLSRHMLVHKGMNMLPTQTEEMAHKCSECGQSFSLISNLESHMLIHTKEEPHKCAQCGEAFRTFTQLQCHVVVHIRAETDLSAAGCAETDPVGPRPLVQGDTNDKEYDHTIGEHEERPFAELHCRTDVSDSIDDTQTTVKTDLAGPWSDENMGQPLRASGCAETNPVGPRPLVKEGDTNDEEYGHMIGEDKDEEKPVAEFRCITETDVTDSIDGTLQIVKIKVKKDEDEHDYLLESKSPQIPLLDVNPLF